MESKMRVGITGAGGNLGIALVHGLRDKYDLRLFDLRVPAHLKQMGWVQLDFAEPDQLTGVFADLDAVIHLAGNPNPSARRVDTIRNNFVTTSFVFEEARQAGVKKIIFASSNFYHQKDIASALRGELDRPITLDACATPDCPYAESKVFGENLGFHYANLGLSFVALRIGWYVPADTPVPYDGAYMRAMFCSKRDLVQAFDKALESEEKCMSAFVISDNSAKVFDLTETRRKLGYYPQDNSADYDRQ